MNRPDKLLRSLTRRDLLINVALAVIHVLAAQLGLLLSHPETHVTLIWPPSGIALVAVLLLGYRVWPGIFIGDIAVAIMEGHPPLMWAIGPLGNTLAAVVGAWILQAFADFDPHLKRLKDILWLALGGGLFGTLISATFGVGTLSVTGRIASQHTLGAWLTWWLGDTIGVTVLAPALLILGLTIREKAPSIRLRGLVRAVGPFGLLMVANLIVFGMGRLFPRRAGLPVAFAAFPAIIWIAMRFGVAGSSVAVLLTAVFGITGTALGYGPFAVPPVQQNLGVLWGYVGITAITALALGAAVTERQQTEEELALRSQLWDSLMDNTPDLVYFKDADHGLIMASQAYADAVGCEPEALVGRTARELWPHEAEEILADERRALSGDPLIHEEREATTAAGEPRWYLLTKVPIYQGGEVIGFFAIDKDITKRKLAEEQLRESRSQYKWLLESMINAFAVYDTIFDEDGTFISFRYVYVNEAYEEIVGVTNEEVQGKTVHEIFPGTEDSWIERYGRVAVTGEPDTFEMYHDPTKKLYYCTVYRPWDTPDRFCVVFEDITEKQKMEDQLRQQERLAAVGQLASGIAHDFRNLLTTIILYASLPLHKPDLPPDLAENLETIKGEAEKATELVQQILDFSSSAMIERRPLDLEPFLADVLAVLRRTIPETIEITMDAGADGTYTVAADAGRLQQALTNLALNARDAMPDGGELHVELSSVEIPTNAGAPPGDATRGDWDRVEPGQWICLAVSDTGMGMSELVQEHLFEPFFTTKDVGEGTGLGLAQVYGIVRQHEGVIDVETELGEGTTFRIYLPSCDEAGAPQEEKGDATGASDAPRGQGETILLVEDEENVRQATQEMLETLGYRVITASNGREALALCQSPRWHKEKPPVDLVVTDLVMPEIGGRELMKRLQAARHGLKALGITGYTLEEGDVQLLKETGFVAVIRKPFEADDLAGPIRRALEA